MKNLNKPSLVLNKHWLPVDVVSVRRALSNLYQDKVKAIQHKTYEVFDFFGWCEQSTEEQPVLTFPTGIVDLPQLVLATNYDEFPDKSVTLSRRNIYIRDDYQCQFCGCYPGSEELSIDHLIPKRKGGRTTWKNCVVACTECNFKKRDRTPREANMPLLRKPYKPHWNIKYVAPCKIDQVPEAWKNFVSDEAYWNVKLED